VNKDIVVRIETVIDHLELSVSAFADEIGVQRSSISHLLSGRNKPSLDFVMKLVDTYPEVDLYWLLKGIGSFPKEVNAQAKDEVPTGPLEKHENTIPSSIPSTGNEVDAKEPSRIVLFYPDGTFQTFNPKKD